MSPPLCKDKQSREKAAFVPILPPQHEKPKADFWGPAGVKSALRNQLTLEGWLCLGGVLQALILYAVGPMGLIPPVVLLLYRGITIVAMERGWIHNTYLDGVLKTKVATVFPDDHGIYGDQPADRDVVVFLIGARCNHPYAILAPKFLELCDYYTQMAKDLDESAEDEFGFLGQTSWTNNTARETCSETMSVCYFRSIEGLHKFAHSEYHRKGREWFDRISKEHSHISVWHEVYHAPKRHWESVYINSHISGINTTRHRITDSEGNIAWVRPMVDGHKEVLRTSAGRLGQTNMTRCDRVNA